MFSKYCSVFLLNVDFFGGHSEPFQTLMDSIFVRGRPDYFGSFWTQRGYLGGSNIIVGFTHIVQQLLVSMFPSTFDFDLIFGCGCFGTWMGYLWGSMYESKKIWGLVMLLNNFHFHDSFNSDFWIWLIFGVVFGFSFSPNWLFLSDSL